MNIVILGLKGTGKTTLAKEAAKRYGFNYVRDYDICKNEIDEQEVFEFICSHDECVFDLFCSLSIRVCAKLNNCAVYCLGFATISEDLLLKLMQEKGAKVSKETVSEFKAKSRQLKRYCEKYNITFVDVNKDRAEIIEEILAEIDTAISH